MLRRAGIQIQASKYSSTRAELQFKNIPLTRGVIMRGNDFEMDAGIYFQVDSVRDVVIEGNSFSELPVAVCFQGLHAADVAASGVLLGKNKLDETVAFEALVCRACGSHSTLASYYANNICLNYSTSEVSDQPNVSHGFVCDAATKTCVLSATSNLTGWRCKEEAACKAAHVSGKLLPDNP